jgi:hypothetical protein
MRQTVQKSGRPNGGWLPRCVQRGAFTDGLIKCGVRISRHNGETKRVAASGG